MSLNIDDFNKGFEFIIGAITICGFLYGGWKWIIRPIKSIYAKMENLEVVIQCVNNEILPVIQSLSKEFSKNSGKSIMDRILRIDDNTRLAELRSKLLASNILTTSMVEFDKNGNLIWANKAFLNITGLDLEQLKGNGWFVCIDESQRARVWTLWKHSIDTDIPFESEFLIKNQIFDDEKSVKCIVYPHKSIDSSIENPVLGFYGTVIEVSN